MGFLQLRSLGLVAPQPVGPSRTRDGTCVPCIGFMDRVAGYSPFPGWNTLRGPRLLHECALSGRLPARPPRERRISHKGERESAARPSCSPPPASSLGSPLRPSSPVSPGQQCRHPGPSASRQPASLPPRPFQLRWALSPGHTGKGCGPQYPRPCSPTLPSSAQAPPVCQARLEGVPHSTDGVSCQLSPLQASSGRERSVPVWAWPGCRWFLFQCPHLSA
ncbi:unnamed protein product [Rangifer tarandus platyrhynchus]|uniref:Uncharacterized protein n=1 Tax=Rangifer tarandus platyrhynchus TaxID=3082113 RepID=A0ABN8ZFE8_RANTA|nr:unnamed protein product [Rangifer tarandus platyrhynchus]